LYFHGNSLTHGIIIRKNRIKLKGEEIKNEELRVKGLPGLRRPG
jgi:hypothetical protein